MRVSRISKILSANDTGDTGAHQAGMLIPREPRLLQFFPALDPSERNPRCHLLFDDAAGDRWEFAFIYYNNRFFGGTRNEYRLTRMTRFIRENGLIPGDEIILDRSPRDEWKVSVRRDSETEVPPASGFILKLGSGWKIVDL